MAQDLLFELQRRGIRLRVVDGRLDVLAPAGTLTPELRDELRLQRNSLVALLHRAGSGEEWTELVPRPEHRHEPFPLTDIQHAYWVGRNSAVELGGVATHLYLELERTGLDPQRLCQSLRVVIERHDMLRAVIQPDGRQRVLPEVPPYEIAVGDLRGLDAPARLAEITRVRGEMAHQVLRTDRWPLFDIRASRLDDDRLRLHVSLDVLILDGLSLYVLFQEWRRCYEDPDRTLAPPRLSYRDYVLYEESLRDGSRYTSAEKYWLARLDTLPLAPALPLATQPAQLPRTEFTRHTARLSRDRWDAVKRIARRYGVTYSVVLMTAFADVLRLWSTQQSFTLNVTLFNRPRVHPEIDQIIGDFTALNMLEVPAGADDSFTARARRLQQQLAQDLEHAAYSGVRVLRERARRLGGGPAAAMPVVFTGALALAADGEDPAEGIRFFGEQVYGISQTPQVWLDHQVAEDRGELVFNWDAVAALFPDGLLDDMFGVYCGVLDRLSRDEDAWDVAGPLVSLPSWQLAERGQANDSAADIPARTLCELVEEQAARDPYATAVISPDGRFTYRELVDQAHRLAGRLLALGAARNLLVGVVMDPGREQVAAVLGVVSSGAAYLPIDPQWPAARRDQLLAQGGVRLVVTTPRLRDELAWPPDIRLVTFADTEVGVADSGPPASAPSPSDLAYVIFTSGSTGQPKGVMIDHRGAANTVQDINRRFEVGPGDRVLALSALSFDLSVYDIFGTLAAGGAVVLPAPAGVHDPTHWSDLVERHGVTIWNSVPALMQAWLAAHPPAAAAPGLKLRLVLLSGDWSPVTLPDGIRARYPATRVVSLGGATEASIWSVYYQIAEVPPEWTSIPYGKPLANQTLHVYDERLEPCPVWTAGEIYIGGTGVAKGYWADPDRTAERFITHPRTGDRLYRTGDLGRYLPGGDIEFLGRQDLQVKLNGYRIELGEIAATLRRQAGVADAIVGVDTNPVTGRRHLVAHVVPATGAGKPAPAPDTSAAWHQVIDEGGSELRSGLVDLAADLRAYRAVWRAIEEFCPAIMARTLARLGEFGTAGQTTTAADIVARHGLKPGYRGLVDQWLSVLADSGVLSPGEHAGQYRCEQALDRRRLDAEVREAFSALDAHGGQRVIVDYLRSSADNQVAMLRGAVSPLQLLLPDGNPEITEALYATNPASHLHNRIAARVVGAFVDRLPAARRVRILEVGAGIGATTAQVLPGLPVGRVHYSFTDVSAYFTERAKLRFRAYPCVDYGLFDVDREPSSQGFPPGSADLIVAANVLHDAKDLDRTLRQLRSVLAPGGVLLLIEGTANSLIQMVSVGFIEGLGNYQDQRTLPLLSVPQWHSRMESAGFVRFASIPDGEAATDVHVQHVILGGAPDDQPRPRPEALREALEGLLPDYLVPRHYVVVDAMPLSANGKVDRSALPSPWRDAAPEERVAPRTETERWLFEIWCEALGRDDFGIEDNFFELGGDSLHAVRILGRLRDELSIQDSADEGLQMLFDFPTIAELATALPDRVGS